MDSCQHKFEEFVGDPEKLKKDTNGNYLSSATSLALTIFRAGWDAGSCSEGCKIKAAILEIDP